MLIAFFRTEFAEIETHLVICTFLMENLTAWTAYHSLCISQWLMTSCAGNLIICLFLYSVGEYDGGFCMLHGLLFFSEIVIQPNSMNID
jgi:hypothetical protein